MTLQLNEGLVGVDKASCKDSRHVPKSRFALEKIGVCAVKLRGFQSRHSGRGLPSLDTARAVTKFQEILTTTRPRTCPSMMRRAASMTPDRSISLVIAASLPASRTDASRLQASRRLSIGHITESMPMSETP